MQLKNALEHIPHLLTVKASAEKAGVNVYLVGGVLRDFYLGRVEECNDFDFIVSHKAKSFAQGLAKKMRSKMIVLDDEEKTYRVILKKSKALYYYDFAQMRGGSLENDLKHRDFSINTLSVLLNQYPDVNIYDPLGGSKDIRRRLVRVAERKVLVQDPLRILRAFSIALRFSLRIDEKTLMYLGEYRNLLKKVSAERINEELFKILRCEQCHKTIKKMADYKILDEIIPALGRCRGVTQEGGFHHLDVFDHSLETLLRFEMMYRKKLSGNAEVIDYLHQELAGGRTREQIIKLACLLHDIGKPKAKKRKNKKTIFYQHEKFGTNMAEEIALKLKLSVKEKESLKKLIFWHLRPGYLADIRLPSKRAIYRFFRDAGDDGVAIILLSLADWRATRGPKTSQADKLKHERIMISLLTYYFDEKKKKPLKPIVNGYDIMNKFNLTPSPVIGEILSHIHEEQAVGKITHKKDAYVLAHTFITKKRRAKCR